MKKYKATVIINTYKEEESRLVRAIEGYLNQEDVDMQIIISTVEGDPSIKLAKEFNLDLCVSDKAGIYSQLNNALKHIKHDWYAYASGNDIPASFKMFQEIDKCVKNNKLVCYSAFRVINEISNTKITRRFHDYSYNKHLKGNFVNDCATIHKSLIDKYTPFNHETWGNHSYWDLWLRIYKGEGNVFVYNDNPTWDYIITKDSSHVKRSKNIEKKMINTKLRNELLEYHGRKRS